MLTYSASVLTKSCILLVAVIAHAFKTEDYLVGAHKCGCSVLWGSLCFSHALIEIILSGDGTQTFNSDAYVGYIPLLYSTVCCADRNHLWQWGLQKEEHQAQIA